MVCAVDGRPKRRRVQREAGDRSARESVPFDPPVRAECDSAVLGKARGTSAGPLDCLNRSGKLRCECDRPRWSPKRVIAGDCRRDRHSGVNGVKLAQAANRGVRSGGHVRDTVE